MNKMLRALLCSLSLAMVADAKHGNEIFSYTVDHKDVKVLAQADVPNQTSKKNVSLKKVKAKPSTRAELMQKWQKYLKEKKAHQEELGKYADLYLQPGWPLYAQYPDNKYLFQVGMHYAFATDAYNDQGINGDVASLAFGDKAIQVQDLLLASKLVHAEALRHQPAIALSTDNINAAVAAREVIQSEGRTLNLSFPFQTPHQYLDHLAEEAVVFNGKRQRTTTDMSLTRYIWRERIAFGINVPLVYEKRHLTADINVSKEAQSELQKLVSPGYDDRNSDGAAQDIASAGAVLKEPTAFALRYGQDSKKFLDDIFKSKGINELGGSAFGLGDISFFTQINIKTEKLDRALVGFNIIAPTAKKASTSKLWAPELGNGGFWQAAASTAMAISYSRYCNPHFMLEGTYSFPGHQDKRIPKLVSVTDTDPIGATNPLDRDYNVIERNFIPSVMTFSDRVALLKSKSFSDYDTTFRELGDNLVRMKVHRGVEFNARLGNVIENFVLHRAACDVYYELRGKLQDTITDVDTALYNAEVYRQNSQRIAHRIGSELSYQFNHEARLRAGVAYTFAGRNVEKQLDCSLILNYSF